MLQILSNFNLDEDSIHFLVGLKGNGITSKLNAEIESTNPENVIYITLLDIQNFDADNLEDHVLILLLEKLNEKLETGFKLDDSAKSSTSILSDFFNYIRTFESSIPERHILTIIDMTEKILPGRSVEFLKQIKSLLTLNSILHQIHITSVFLVDEYFDPSNQLAKWNPLLFYNDPHAHIVPSFTIEESMKSHYFYLKNLSKISEKVLIEAHKLSGGNPSLLQSVLSYYIFNNTFDNVLSDGDVKWKVDIIFRNIGSENQKVVSDLVFNQKTPKFSNPFQKEFMIKTGILNNEGNALNFLLFEPYLKSDLSLTESLSNSNKEIIISDTKIDPNDFDPKSEKVFLYLYENKNRVVTRDEIAKVLWGADYINSHSDYAIDKHLSNLRGILNSKYKLVPMKVLKKRGVLLSA